MRAARLIGATTNHAAERPLSSAKKGCYRLANIAIANSSNQDRNMSNAAFASDFPPATYAQWRILAEKVVKDSSFDESLVSTTDDGIKIQPLYAKAEGNAALVERPRTWTIAQRVDHPDPHLANKICLDDLANGADGLVLLGAGAPTARDFGLTRNSLIDALDDVSLDLISVRIDAGAEAQSMSNELVNLALWRKLPLDLLNFDFGLDPIGCSARSGTSPVADSLLDSAAQLVLRCGQSRALLADGRPYHEAGATEAQELGFVIATALFYIRALEQRGVNLEAARSGLSFLLVADADVFMTLSKFRALRRLWARVEEACGLSPKPIRLHAETAWRMVTNLDPHINILRATMATFAAGLGGADAITALPFTIGLGLPDAFARRIARNTQAILQEEAYLSRVIDPAEGSGAFESLTHSLCEKAWQELQEIERAGGMTDALATGKVQAAISLVREGRFRAIADHKHIIIGTTAFINPDKQPISILQDVPRFKAAPPTKDHGTFAPLPSLRDAEPFDSLPDQSGFIP